MLKGYRVNRKGFGLMGFSLVIALTLFIFIILNALNVLSYVIAIGGSVNYMIETDDNGTIMVGLMQSYSNVFAELCTLGHEEGIDRNLNETLERLGKGMKVYHGSTVCYQYGNLKDSIRTQVGLPGGRTGYIEIGDKA